MFKNDQATTSGTTAYSIVGCCCYLLCTAIVPGLVALSTALQPDERMSTPRDSVEQYFAGMASTIAAIGIQYSICASVSRSNYLTRYFNRIIAILIAIDSLLALATFVTTLCLGLTMRDEAPLGINHALHTTEYMQERPVLASYLVALVYSQIPTMTFVVIPGLMLRYFCHCCARSEVQDERMPLLSERGILSP